MGLLHFFQKLFRCTGSQVALVQPSVRVEPQQLAVPVVHKPPGLMLLREEMLDSTGRLAGYRFSCGVPEDGAEVSMGRYLAALHEAHVKALAERRTAVISLRLEDGLGVDFTELVAQGTVFHVLARTAQLVAPSSLPSLKALRDKGAGLALSVEDISNLPALAPALALATHAIVDISAQPVESFEQLVIALQEACPHVVIVVDNVATWPVRHMCVAMGIEFAMGYFLSTIDEREYGEKMSDSRMVLMDMLNLVRNDGDAEALAAVAKRDPGVAVHLLSMANSPAYGLKAPLTGIDQAIVVLGRETLYRWLAVSLFRVGTDQARDEALLEVALARASFLEKAGLAVGSRQHADELFLVGLLSFIDTLLGLPMATVLKDLTLPAVVKDVLLSSEGPYGRFLLLALAVERCQVQRAMQLASSLGIQPDALTSYRNEARQWAEQAVQAA
ncbi:MAG TPA: HDOD domain-containing protein [Aquabacterium sp.]|uniref:EAL and HDOD domain-containing protein n=1 Tax=Aquabacterium sp. TaxID=1872578 RepID=UPI002E323BDD|nr:HDOD domain-containing protein [Aquabacterium sp.]HEX5357075.1 HDOD domain-containing protein [Aquabacterium sp.]